MTWLLAAVLVAAAIAAVLYGMHRLATWAERHGWIYYRSDDRKGPLPMGMLEEIYQPSVEHTVIELSDEAIRADQDESGADPGPGRLAGDERDLDHRSGRFVDGPRRAEHRLRDIQLDIDTVEYHGAICAVERHRGIDAIEASLAMPFGKPAKERLQIGHGDDAVELRYELGVD